MENSKKGASSNMMYIVAAIVLVLAGLLIFSRMNSTEAPTQENPGVAQTEPTSNQVMEAQETTVTESESTTPGEAMESTESADADDDDVTTIEVEGGPFYFKPATLTVKKGEKVKLVFTNAKGMHDFVIDELNVKTEIINGGESDTVEFTPTKAGTFKYYCSVGNHRAQGMEGTITVE